MERILVFLCAFVLFVSGAVAATQKCPASASSMHAGCETQLEFKDSCSSVRNEINKRVSGQFDAWYDPHNNGTYTFVAKADSLYQLSRLTGDKKYTDLINFVFEDAGTGCNVAACSESQSFSIGDYGTNYCNILDLYCSDARCKPFAKLEYTEKVGKCTEVSPDKCFVK